MSAPLARNFRARFIPPSNIIAEPCLGPRMDEDTLARVEAQRSELEANIAKLKKSLHHWQTLELDYEGLREEFYLLPDDSSPGRCLQAARDFGAELVDEKDLQSLLDDAKSSRGPQQLAHLLSKRVEYVAKNAETIRKQIVDAEKRRNALLLAEDPEHQYEAGLPLTEITEELDESGNVVSSKVDRPGGEAAGLLDVLKKAGVDGIKTGENNPPQVDAPSSERATVGSSANVSITTPEPANDPSSDEGSSVDEEIAPSAAAEAAQESSRSDGQSIKGMNPFDTADEARLREEMLQYQGLDEVGAIVAELDLAEGGSEADYDPDDDDLLIGSETDEDDDDSEDETGKTKHPAISDAYKNKMEELEQRLGLKDMKNLGPDPNLPADMKKELDRPPAAEAARKAAIARAEATAKSSIKKSEDTEGEPREKKAKKKSVAFADSLDVAKEEPPQKKQKLPSHPKPEPAVNPVGESVIERTEDAEENAPPPPAPTATGLKKISRFKRDKQAATQTPPTASQEPKPKPLIAPTVLERPSTSDPMSHQPPDPTSIDDEMHRRELALEYHKLKNRRIHNQGGYTQHLDEDGDEEDFDDAMQDYGVVDPETGAVRKVSRFKAARVRG